MEFVELTISPTKRYSYKDSSNIKMNILGDFLASDVGYHPSSFTTWALDSSLDEANSNLTSLRKKDDHILLTDLFSDKRKLTELRMMQEQFVQVLDDWQKKVCNLQPSNVIITYDDVNDSFILETNNEINIEAGPTDAVPYFPIVPHKYPLWIKMSFISCCIMLSISCFRNFPYYFQLSELSKKAHHAFKTQNYAEASFYFGKLHQELPANKYLKRYLAQSLFKSDNIEHHHIALVILSEVTLGKGEWKQLLEYMPAQYTKHFKTVRR